MRAELDENPIIMGLGNPDGKGGNNDDPCEA